MKTFGKKSSCPTSEEIFSCVQGSPAVLVKLRIEEHTRLCDFCGAEMQLLTKYSTIREHRRRAPKRTLISFLHINRPVIEAPAIQRARAA